MKKNKKKKNNEVTWSEWIRFAFVIIFVVTIVQLLKDKF